MFKVVGSIVIYGFATYGLYQWWKKSNQQAAANVESVFDQVNGKRSNHGQQ